MRSVSALEVLHNRALQIDVYLLTYLLNANVLTASLNLLWQAAAHECNNKKSVRNKPNLSAILLQLFHIVICRYERIRITTDNCSFKLAGWK